MATLYDVKIGRSLFLAWDTAIATRGLSSAMLSKRACGGHGNVPLLNAYQGALPMSYRDTVLARVYGINRVISLLIHYYIIFALIMSLTSSLNCDDLFMLMRRAKRTVHPCPCPAPIDRVAAAAPPPPRRRHRCMDAGSGCGGGEEEDDQSLRCPRRSKSSSSESFLLGSVGSIKWSDVGGEAAERTEETVSLFAELNGTKTAQARR